MSCWDCGKRVGIRPAMFIEGVVMFVCSLCWNRNYRAVMHADDCGCPHCESSKSLVKETIQ